MAATFSASAGGAGKQSGDSSPAGMDFAAASGSAPAARSNSRARVGSHLREVRLEVEPDAVELSFASALFSVGDADATPTRFGIRSNPGMRSVAVSRELEKLGLRQGVRITIDGVPGE